MLDSIFSGLSGLLGFSKGLSNISNNVANLNSPGYKARQLMFSDLFYKIDPGQADSGTTSPFSHGSGMEAGSERLSMVQGDFRSTGNDLDVSVEGNGFFVFKRDGEEFYTRAGQFELDDAGYMVIRGTHDRVQFLSDGDLVDLNAENKRDNPAKATTTVKFVDRLDTVQATPPYSTNATVIDSLGGTHTLTFTFTFTNTPVAEWNVEVKEGSAVIGSGKLRFDSSTGAALDNFDNFDIELDPDGVGAAPKMTVNFDFSATKSLVGTSTLNMGSQNGVIAGSLTRISFSEDGTITYNYSNGQKTIGPALALASFNNVSALQAVGDTAFVNRSGQERALGKGGTAQFGSLKGGGVEASNVDLAAQFSELIITQRGYQASSQIITAANEMIQQLLEMRGRR